MVPVISIAGANHSARTGASILHAAGLGELAVADMAAYRAKALHLARNPDVLADLKSRLLAKHAAAPLFDTPRLARHLEAAYGEMIRRRRAPARRPVPLPPPRSYDASNIGLEASRWI